MICKLSNQVSLQEPALLRAHLGGITMTFSCCTVLPDLGEIHIIRGNWWVKGIAWGCSLLHLSPHEAPHATGHRNPCPAQVNLSLDDHWAQPKSWAGWPAHCLSAQHCKWLTHSKSHSDPVRWLKLFSKYWLYILSLEVYLLCVWVPQGWLNATLRMTSACSAAPAETTEF